MQPPTRSSTLADEIDYIVSAARAAAWIGRESHIAVTRTIAGMRVELTDTGITTEKTYASEELWVYEFLRDLAHGYWKREHS